MLPQFLLLCFCLLPFTFHRHSFIFFCSQKMKTLFYLSFLYTLYIFFVLYKDVIFISRMMSAFKSKKKLEMKLCKAFVHNKEQKVCTEEALNMNLNDAHFYLNFSVTISFMFSLF